MDKQAQIPQLEAGGKAPRKSSLHPLFYVACISVSLALLGAMFLYDCFSMSPAEKIVQEWRHTM